MTAEPPPRDLAAQTDIRVLLVEDNPGDARLVQEHFRDMQREGLFDRVRASAGVADVEVTHVSTLGDGLDLLSENAHDVVLLDLQLPDSDGLASVDSVISTAPDVPVVVLTGMPEERLGIDAVSRGAQDYLPKDDLAPRILLKTIQYAIERKEQERELRRRSEQLGILTRLTRHDIRNDVSLIVGRARELTEYVEPRGRGQLEEIIQSGNHVLQLTRTIGDALDAITGETTQPLAAVELRSVLRSEVETASALYQGAEITLGEVPDVTVRANRLLSSVVANLINNGVFYNDKDVPRVHVEAAADEETVTIRVSDNGPGIPTHQRQLLFEGEMEEDERGGLGIGLTLVHRFVDQYGGSIQIEDNEPEGTRFVIALQRA